MPPADSPNVLLVVLDTVRADRLSLYGYPRAPRPPEAAGRSGESASTRRGRPRPGPFRRTRACSPAAGPMSSTWTGTLAADQFSDPGRISRVSWLCDRGLCRQYPAIAPTTPAWTAASLILKTTSSISSTSAPCGRPCSSSSPGTGFPSWVCGSAGSRYQPVLHWFLATDRKDAGAINREFLDWLSHRQDRRRPFFAFLNYFDAHAPYLPPEGTQVPLWLRARGP